MHHSSTVTFPPRPLAFFVLFLLISQRNCTRRIAMASQDLAGSKRGFEEVEDNANREDEAREMIARFLAPIKREFRVAQGGAGGALKRQDTKETVDKKQEEEEERAETRARGEGCQEDVEGEGQDGVVRPDREAVIAARKERKEQKKKSKQEERGRGQNKQREHKASLNARVNAALPSLCKKISRGLVCPYEGKCKFSHDISGYLEKAKELPDVPIGCPFSTSIPPRRCPFGLSCRSSACRDAFASKLAARTCEDTGDQNAPGLSENEHKADADHQRCEGLTIHEDEVNHLSRDVQAQLREVRGKGVYKYEKWHLEHAGMKKV